MGEQFNSNSITMQAFFFLLMAAVAFAEPEAKPEAEADPALLYPSYYGYPYASYGYGYYGYPYAYSNYYGYGYPYNYGYRYLWKRDAEADGKPVSYYANSGGAVHIVKRDAEANPEADAQYYYGRYYGYARPYGYYGYPYGRYYWGK